MVVVVVVVVVVALLLHMCQATRESRTCFYVVSVHTLHMSKPAITFVFKALRNGLLGFIHYTRRNL